MDPKREEELIRRSLELHPWPTEEEMLEYIKECEANPMTIEELMASIDARLAKRSSEESTEALR